jgi:hypothetical protein
VVAILKSLLTMAFRFILSVFVGNIIFHSIYGKFFVSNGNKKGRQGRQGRQKYNS